MEHFDNVKAEGKHHAGLQFLSWVYTNSKLWPLGHFWLHLFREIKFYWNTAMPTYLHTVSGCFHATMKRWSGCNSSHPTKSKIFTLWLLHTGSLPTSALGHCFSNFNVHTGLLGILLNTASDSAVQGGAWDSAFLTSSQ